MGQAHLETGAAALTWCSAGAAAMRFGNGLHYGKAKSRAS